MSAEALQMRLSQESLFFPLPFTNATIDNVVEVQNPLPVVPGDPKANVVSFKILSEVQCRYSVHPSVGFIGPGSHITIVFSFNPEQVKAAKNPADRELPTEATRDAIHIDFAVVDPASTAAALAHWVPGGKDSKPSREVAADASAFWKKRGQVTKNTATMRRFRLRCVFATRNNVPESLVISMKEEESKKAAEVNAAVPKSRPPPTSTTDPRATAPPGAPPHRASETPREVTPRNDGAPAAPASRPTVPAATTAAAAAAPAAAAAARTALPPTAPAAPSPKPAVKFPSSSSAGEKKGIVAAVMNYKLSYAVVAVLLVLTFFCGLWDHSNLLTWLIAR